MAGRHHPIIQRQICFCVNHFGGFAVSWRD
jgi:hypothetical protein